jgi:lipopolysaccharide export system protein LptA
MLERPLIKITWSLLLMLFCVNSYTQQVRSINILNADHWDFAKVPGQPDIQKLIGNVAFSDSTAIMYCDSAYYYSSNKIDAFSHIRIVQTSGALNITSEVLNYDGSKKLAELHKNVVLNDEDINLRTNAIYYDMRAAVASYNDSAHIVNKGTVITSKHGQYYKMDKSIHFQKNVIIIDPQYKIFSDTVNYGTVSKITEFFGPTHIITDKDSIYCERGWYNTLNENSHLYKNPFIITEGRKIKADTLTYLKSTGFGRAVNNVEIIDTAQNAIIKGNFAIYNPEQKQAIVTDSALLIQISEGDSLFIHADTIRSQKDSTEKYNILKAYYKVRMFRKDLQGKCDSLCYSSVDSTLQFHGSPVLWSDSSQLTAEYILMYMVNKKINRLELKNSAFLISRDDSTKYSQIKGKTMTGYFADGKLTKLVVKGNGQTIHFPKDNNEYTGMNKTSSSDVIIYLKEGKIEDIVLLVKPEGTLFPLKDVLKEDMFLKDFKWQEDKKPLSKEDIFIWK